MDGMDLRACYLLNRHYLVKLPDIDSAIREKTEKQHLFACYPAPENLNFLLNHPMGHIEAMLSQHPYYIWSASKRLARPASTLFPRAAAKGVLEYKVIWGIWYMG